MKRESSFRSGRPTSPFVKWIGCARSLRTMPRRPPPGMPGMAAGRLRILWRNRLADAASRVSFDHVVGDREYARRDAQAERFCCLEIDDQIKLGRLQDGEIAGLFSLEDSSSVDASLTVGIDQTSAVAD